MRHQLSSKVHLPWFMYTRHTSRWTVFFVIFPSYYYIVKWTNAHKHIRYEIQDKLCIALRHNYYVHCWHIKTNIKIEMKMKMLSIFFKSATINIFIMHILCVHKSGRNAEILLPRAWQQKISINCSSSSHKFRIKEWNGNFSKHIMDTDMLMWHVV